MVAEQKLKTLPELTGPSLQLLELPMEERVNESAEEILREISHVPAGQIAPELADHRTIFTQLRRAVQQYAEEQTIHGSLENPSLLIKGVLHHNQIRWFMNEAASFIGSQTYQSAYFLEKALRDQLTFVFEEVDMILEQMSRDDAQIPADAYRELARERREWEIKKRFRRGMAPVISQETIPAPVLKPEDAPEVRRDLVDMLAARRAPKKAIAAQTKLEHIDLQAIRAASRRKHQAAVAALQAKYGESMVGPAPIQIKAPTPWVDDLTLPLPEEEIGEIDLTGCEVEEEAEVVRLAPAPRAPRRPRRGVMGNRLLVAAAALAAVILPGEISKKSSDVPFANSHLVQVLSEVSQPEVPEKAKAPAPAKAKKTHAERVSHHGNAANVNCDAPYSTFKEHSSGWGGFDGVNQWVDSQPQLKGATICEAADAIAAGFTHEGRSFTAKGRQGVAKRVMAEASFIPELVEDRAERDVQVARYKAGEKDLQAGSVHAERKEKKGFWGSTKKVASRVGKWFSSRWA